ncbi:MAG: hypothetical protein K6G90_04610 [Clostridia bacterium]|nr:hypothetical protein [Clostridia bacterium]
MKRILSILITMIMLAGVIAVPGVITASAADLRTGDYVTFGSYPQTRVVDVDLLDALNSQTLNWTYYDYYVNGVREDFMKYADVTISGIRYRAVRFMVYRPSCTNASYDDSYQDDNGYVPGQVYWFRYEPIVWRVLDPDAGLLMTEEIIDSQPFNNELYGDEYGNAGHTHYASNWAYSSLRSWMNGDFYDTAFDVEKVI